MPASAAHRIGRSVVLDVPEGYVDAWPRNPRFFWSLVFELQLRLPCHDQQAAMWQALGKDHEALVAFDSEETFRAQTDRSDHRSHFRLGVCVQSYAVISVPVEIAKRRVVAQFRQVQIGIGARGRSLFDATL